jgi:dTDP-D-glucose 4,6-dehydratase
MFTGRTSFPRVRYPLTSVYGISANHAAEIIPKFIMLLQRQRKLLLHGTGTPTRRYLFASDIVDALDTILHRGSIGQIYNIATKDEISNLEICYKLLSLFDIPHFTPMEFEKLVEFTEDRPFNDQRYATDGSKLAALGWVPRVGFEEGLAKTVEWYKRFGEVWWGDISRVLTSFPVVEGTEIWTREEHDALPLDAERESGTVWAMRALDNLNALRKVE